MEAPATISPEISEAASTVVREAFREALAADGGIERIVARAVQHLVTTDALTSAQLLDARILTKQDVIELVPWKERKVDQMISQRRIPMFKQPKDKQWIITYGQFRRAAEAGFPFPND